MKDQDKILDRIKKLFAKQKSAEEIGSVAEAESFAAKIQEMLLKYNLSLKDISFEELKENIIQKTLSTKIASVSYTLGYKMMYPIAKHNFCRVYTVKDAHEMIIVGTPENIEICEMLYSLTLEIYQREGKKKYKLTTQRIGLDTYLREFLDGCRKGLDAKFKAEKERLALANPGTTALIVVNDKAVVEYVTTRFSLTPGRRQPSKGPTEAWMEGFNTGRNTDLHKKLE